MGNIINGVSIDDLDETVKTVQKQPAMAKFVFKASNQWVNGGHNQTAVKEFYGAYHTYHHDESFVFDEDVPPLLLGKEKGAYPVEYVLVALAGCLTTSLVYHAAARGYHIEQIESELEGDLDFQGFLGINDNVRNGYQGLKVKFKIKSDIPDHIIDELVQIAQERSPVFDIIQNPVNVSVECENL